MTVELISFRSNLTAKKRLELMISIVNQSQADLIVFCGHTLKDRSDLDALKCRIENKNTFVLFEIKQCEESDFLYLKNCLYTIADGIVHNMYTNQFFATSNEIEGNESLCERFINELETRRQFNVKGKNCLVLQCGEINIIKNIQKEGNKPIFRIQERLDLKERFDNLLKDTQIILNPIHTPMGNQGKMKKRREYLSANNKYYFSVSQSGDFSMESRCLQYSFYDGGEIWESDIGSTKEYQRRIFNCYWPKPC